MMETMYNITFLVIQYQCWHHMTLMASSISPMHLIVHNYNEMKHNFFSYLTLLALASASCDANGTVNSTIAFSRSRQLKQCATSHCWSCNAIDGHFNMMSTVSSMAPFHLSGQDGQKGKQHDIFGPVMPLAPALASCDAKSIINGNTAFVQSN